MNIQNYTLKTLGMLLLLFSGMADLRAHTPELKWATNIGGLGTEYISAVAQDDAGFVYVAGYFSGLTDFNPLGGTVDTITPVAGSDAFVSKMDSAGNLVWVRAIGGAGNQQAQGLGLDDSGNVYISGFFNNLTDFDPGRGAADTFNVRNVSSNDIFVLKLNAAGDFVWVATMGGSGNDRSLALAVDPAGNAYVGGAFAGNACYFGTVDTLSSKGSTDGFVCRVDSAGDINWVRQIGAGGADQVNVLTLDVEQNLYVGGQFTDSAYFGSTFFIVNKGNKLEGFATKLDPAGNFLWAASIGGEERGDRVEGMQTDEEGHLYLTGGFCGNANFDPNGTFELTATPSWLLPSDPGTQALEDIFIAKWDTAGNFIWAKKWGGGAADYAKSISLDKAGSMYVVCDYLREVDFDVATLQSVDNGNDVAILKLDTSGNILWAGSVGGNSFDHVQGVVADQMGNVYVAGRYQSHLNTDFDPGPDVLPMPATTNTAGTSGTIDAFIMRLYRCMEVGDVVRIEGPEEICPGNTYVFSVGRVSGAVSYEWHFPQSWQVTGSGASVTAEVDNQPGEVYVLVRGMCDSSEVTVQVRLVMPPLEIGAVGDRLSAHSEDYETWQWYKDGVIIEGAVDSFYTVAENATYSLVVTGSDGCRDSAAYMVNNVAVAQLLPEGGVSVYPNPASNIVQIEAAGMRTVHISGTDGRSLMVLYPEQSRIRADISVLPPGVYLVDIRDETGRQIGLNKLVKTEQ